MKTKKPKENRSIVALAGKGMKRAPLYMTQGSFHACTSPCSNVDMAVNKCAKFRFKNGYELHVSLRGFSLWDTLANSRRWVVDASLLVEDGEIVVSDELRLGDKDTNYIFSRHEHAGQI